MIWGLGREREKSKKRGKGGGESKKDVREGGKQFSGCTEI
jgi:hypothetical protein